MVSLCRRVFAVAALSAWPANAAWVVDVPLTSGAGAADAFVKSHGGKLQGGTFSGQGWTTTSRSDSMEIPLPAGIDARRGKLTVTFANPELSGPKGFFESWVLVSVDTSGVPFAPIQAGQAGVQVLYLAYNEFDETLAQARAYFNLYDPSCTDWKLCTAEGASKKGWLAGAGEFTSDQTWDGPKDALSFTPGGGAKQIDLSATSPSGAISGKNLVLSINACGGSKSNACGLWDGATHGGPLGITYSMVRLELSDAPGGVDAGAEGGVDAASEAAAGGSAGAGGSRSTAGAAGTAAAGGTGGGSPSVGGAGTVAGGDADAGCGCRIGRRQLGFGLFVAALAFFIRRRRGPLNPWSAV